MNEASEILNLIIIVNFVAIPALSLYPGIQRKCNYKRLIALCLSHTPFANLLLDSFDAG